MSDKKTASTDSNDRGKEAQGSVSRRGFIKGLGAGGIGSALAPAAVLGAGTIATAGTLSGTAGQQGEVSGPGKVPIRLRVNGQAMSVEVEPRETLLDVLRQDRGVDGEFIDVTGNKRSATEPAAGLARCWSTVV